MKNKSSLLLIIASGLLSARFFIYTWRYSVNLLFWDQWDFLTPFFTGGNNPWQLFVWQHGPHRQGLGELWLGLLMNFSHWNTKADSIFIALAIVLSMFVFLYLKSRTLGPLSFQDTIIPLIVLNLQQSETLIQTPNISHSALPLFLLSLFFCCFLIKDMVFRFLSLWFLSSLLLFTGFGIFVFPLTLLYFLSLIVSLRDSLSSSAKIMFWLGLLALMISLRLFLLDYHFNPAIECFGVSLKSVLSYPAFVSLMYANFVGLAIIPLALVGSVVVLFMVIGAVISFKRFLFFESSGRHRAFIVFGMLSFSLLFASITAVGRTCDMRLASSSRYITLLIPGFIGFYFYLITLSDSILKRTLLGFLILILIFTLIPLRSPEKALQGYRSGKLIWKICYLENRDVAYCNRKTNFRVYPTNDPRIQERLNFLEKNHLNLFLDSTKK